MNAETEKRELLVSYLYNVNFSRIVSKGGAL